MGRSILPKLAYCLDHEFTVNPVDQKLEPWEWAMAWSAVLPRCVSFSSYSCTVYRWNTCRHLLLCRCSHTLTPLSRIHKDYLKLRQAWYDASVTGVAVLPDMVPLT